MKERKKLLNYSGKTSCTATKSSLSDSLVLYTNLNQRVFSAMFYCILD